MKHLLRLLFFAVCLLSSSHALRAQRAKYAAIINALREAELFDEERRAQLTTVLEQDTTLTFPVTLDQDAQLLEASEQGLRLQTSEVGTTEVRLLPAPQGSIIALIETVSSPQTDALITFLSPSGTPLSSTDLLRLPTTEDFLRGLHLPESTASDRLRTLLDPLHCALTWATTSSTPTLLVRPTLLLSEEDKQSDELKALIAQLPSLASSWSGQTFTPFVRATHP
ncbi:DUF3256 family protein [Porphyromonas sp.]